MKKTLLVSAAIMAAALVFAWSTSQAQNAPAGHLEYAMIKWDGPDRIQYILPEKFEVVRLTQTGITIPKEAQEEEFCLAFAANKLAKEGWELAGFDSRRVLMRRSAR